MSTSSQAQLLKESLVAIELLEGRLEQSEANKHEPIALVGAGCRYPGGIEDLEGLWCVLRDGIDAVSEVPVDRWDADAYYSPDRQAAGKMVTKRGGFLKQVDRFEPQLFGISPREAATMDPQQRFLLETSWEALERAAIATDQLSGSATGVFVGITTSDFGQILRTLGPDNSDVYSATGSALNAAAGRLAFTFGLQGPCVAVDTACSSSLVAVHLACRSLRSRECDLALAGGVNVILLPDAMVLFSKWGMLAPDGACKTFDAKADGFVRSEGCAMVALKRLPDALAAGDPILAVIRGSAVNSDGRSSGLTVPNGPAQRAVLQRALADARLEPAQLDYVEAHGTGTPLGDPIEVEALAAVFGPHRHPNRPLLIGSVKTGLGHTEAASGMAGLLKVVMSLRNQTIPPHLHFSEPNPDIPWQRLAISVPTTLTEWPRSERARLAGVSSFGFSGTNAHVIVEEAPRREAQSVSESERVTLVPISAREDGALRELSGRLAEFLDSEPAVSLSDVALTTATGRAHLSERLAIVADSRDCLVRELREAAAGRAAHGGARGKSRPGERPKVAFLYTGQGAQYAGMGKGLYDTQPVFRDALNRAAEVLGPKLGRPLLDVLFSEAGSDDVLSRTGWTQPALFAVEYALTELWRSWGIEPSVVLGHSLGEYVAATVAGVMTLEDGLTLVAERARLMQELPKGGAMAAVFADADSVAQRLRPYAQRLSIAALNGPAETVVSGDAVAVAAVLEGFTSDGIKSRQLDVSHAFHSSRLEPMLDALERAARNVSFATPRLSLISNLTGAAFPAGSGPDAEYWRRHAREPVRFHPSIDALRSSGVSVVVEVGPHPTLLGLVARAAPDATWTTVASLRRGRDDEREMLGALAATYARGATISWPALLGKRGGRRVSLPTYPFQRERYWFEQQPMVQRSDAGHPLLGSRRELATAPGTHVWETRISLASHPWVRDHCVQGAPIVPATAYIEMALAAGAEVLETERVRLRKLENLKPLILRKGESRVLQATLVVDQKRDSASFSVSSRGVGGDWTKHVTAEVEAIAASDVDQVEPLEVVRGRCTGELSGERFYETHIMKGNQWGPFFQGMKQVWFGEGEAVARIEVSPTLQEESLRYGFHPAVSDSCGHCLVAAAARERGDVTEGAFVGGGVAEIRFHRKPSGNTLWAHARLAPSASADGQERLVVGDVRVHDNHGLVSETLGARLWYLDRSIEGDHPVAPRDWFYQPDWQPEALGPKEREVPEGTWVIFADGRGVAEAIRERRSAAGERTVLVRPGDCFSLQDDRATVRPMDSGDMQQLLEAVADAAVLLHLWSLDVDSETFLAGGPASALSVLAAVLRTKAARRPRIWLVTSDTQSAASAEAHSAPFGAALWGLGRALSVEHPELWGGLVDISERMRVTEAGERLAAEVLAGAADDQVALREGERYVARLRRWESDRGVPGAFRVRADATYIVTGGLGGIGLAAADWLVASGARSLLLIGRSGLPERNSWPELARTSSPVGRRVAALLDLEGRGANVEFAALDVADRGALNSCLMARRERGEPDVHGVFHAAGVLQFQPLSEQSLASLETELAAKVAGAWQLHQVLTDAPLDWFVMCSSSSSLLRSPLLGSYAAGNAFLDGLAHYRKARGLPALSINWGTWGEVGMAADAERVRGGGMLSGMRTMSTAQAFAALEQLLQAAATQAAVMPVDWGALARAYPAFASDRFLIELVGERGPSQSGQSTTESALMALRSAMTTGSREPLVAYLRTAAAQTLGMRSPDLDPDAPLTSLGFDSLMAVQLRTQIEADLRVSVPMIEFLDGPTLNHLADSVMRAQGDGPVEIQRAEETSADEWEEGSI